MLAKPAILKKLIFHKLQFYEESLTIYMRLKRDVNNHPELDVSEYHEDFITRLIRDFIRELRPAFISIDTMFALYAIKSESFAILLLFFLPGKPANSNEFNSILFWITK